MMTKPIDPDIKALRGAVRALAGSSPRMLRPNLEFLWDRFIEHPTKPVSAETDSGETA